MKIYVSHSTAFDYKIQLYKPLQHAFASDYDIIFTFPHESDDDFNSKNTIAASDLVLAEVSHASTGQGIELGWADDACIPIICFHKSDTKPSAALRYIAREILAYDREEDMIAKLTQSLR